MARQFERLKSHPCAHRGRPRRVLGYAIRALAVVCCMQGFGLLDHLINIDIFKRRCRNNKMEAALPSTEPSFQPAPRCLAISETDGILKGNTHKCMALRASKNGDVCDLGPCRRFDAESRYAVCVHPKCYRVTLCNPNIEGAVIGRPCGCERAKADEPDIRDGHQIETDGQRQENRCQNASYYCFANKSVAFEVNDNGRHASAWIAPAIDEGITPIKPKRAFGQTRAGGGLETLVFRNID